MTIQSSTPLIAYGDGVHRMPPKNGIGPGYVLTLPTASIQWRGQFLENPDGVHVCKPDGGGGYEWVLLEAAGGGGSYVNVTGDTMTGNLVIDHASSAALLTLDSAAGQDAGILLKEDGTTTYDLYYDSSASAFRLYNNTTLNYAMSVADATDVATFAGDVIVPDEAYGVGWNGSLEVPTKNALYDKIETLGSGGGSAGIETVLMLGGM